ncbi:Esterase/lipase/thioesterase family lipase [Candidatus Methylobacter favarea]|uniref:Esterase/lipase/thioesterase family lipase n=1 Tax=Candidatus Methylobacter favarea TaxID=2707345 RepID=A0A8S0Y6L4_9GAMM|nr:esterase [Candidatus Methylobacter favarea]CAA9891637.1 Esterase/lipase/thioesterase family lipase [Candidatus Methylobacter favarea]
MTLDRNAYLICLLAIMQILTACAPNIIYRSVYETCRVSARVKCDKNSLQYYNVGASDEYMLGFVEIDDQGQLRDRSQMKAVIDTFYKTAASESVLITVFVHGWHHNAQPGDPNIESFKGNLAKLSKVESSLSLTQKRPPRKIIGVYVGWRGESITIPVINGLTFWERKNTAQDGGYLGVTELLLKLEEIANVRNSVLPPIKSRLVVIGHSFGGAVVYSATSQILASRFVDSKAGKGFTNTAKGFGDLVVLLNPAFEALRYAPFYELAEERCSYFLEQVPRLAILTSETDNATKLAFPAGRIFTTFFETHNTIQRTICKRPLILDEGEADRTAVGHYMPLISHSLQPADEKQAQRSANYNNMKNIWSTQIRGGSTRFGAVVLTHLDKTEPRNPYLNIRVNEELIGSHNDVFGEKIMEFLRLLIVLSTSE